MTVTVEKHGDLDAEMYAIAMCIEGLEPLRDKPYSLERVFRYVGERYLETLKERRAVLDSKMAILRERIAREELEKELQNDEADITQNEEVLK